MLQWSTSEFTGYKSFIHRLWSEWQNSYWFQWGRTRPLMRNWTVLKVIFTNIIYNGTIQQLQLVYRTLKDFFLYNQKEGIRNCLKTHPPTTKAEAINHNFVHTEQKAGIAASCRESRPSCGQQGTRLGHITPNLIFIFPSSSVTFVLFHSIWCRTICHFQVTTLYSISHWQTHPLSTRCFNSF